MRRAPRARTQPAMAVNTSSQFRRGWVTTPTVVSDFGGDAIDMSFVPSVKASFGPRLVMRRFPFGDLGALEVGGGRHTSGRAHSHDRAVTAAPGEFEQRRSEVSDARHAIRVAE